MIEKDSLEQQLKSAKEELSALRSSTSWRLGNFLVSTLGRPAGALMKRRRNQKLPIVSVESWVPTTLGTVAFPLVGQKEVHVVLDVDGNDVSDITLHASDDGSPVSFEIRFPISLKMNQSSAVRLRHSGANSPVVRDSAGPKLPTRIEVVRETIVARSRPDDEAKAVLEKRPSVAIVSTFRPQGRGLRTLNRLLSSLSDAGFATIVVDTSTDISETERAEIHRTADLYLERLNTGWDFASWLSVIASYPWLEQTADRLLLINDSNFGPTYPLKDLLEQPWIGGRAPDMWGLTDSLQHGAHIQSYFLMLEQRAVHAGLLSNFASQFTFPVDKSSIIIEGEVGLTNLARQSGLDVAALFPYSQVIEQFEREFDARLHALSSKDPATAFRLEHGLLASSYPLGFLLAVRDDIQNGVALNPTHHFWDVLLRLGSPFIKRELALRNPVPVPLLRSSLRDTVPDAIYQEILAELHPLDNSCVDAVDSERLSRL